MQAVPLAGTDAAEYQRIAQLQRLMSALQGQPVNNPLSGFAKLLNIYSANREMGDIREKAETRRQQESADLSRAFGTISGGVKPWTNPDTGETMGQGAQPGLAGLQAVLGSNPGPAVQRNIGQLSQLAAAFEKDKPKAPEGMRFNAQGGLEAIPGYAESKGQFARATRETPDELRAKAEAGWKSPERLQQEAEIRAKTEARYRAPTQEPLVEIADPNSPTGTRYVPRSQAINQPGKPPSGMRVTTNPDGTVSIEQGRQGMGSKTVSDLEEKIRNATDGLARVDQIGKSFKPEYQQLGTRWSALATAVKEKVGFEPDTESRAALADFSKFKREALNNLNLYIKEITGAAMSNAEAERITRALPNPGTGLMDGDSPTEFQAKMESVQRELRAAVGRANYALKNGLSPMSIPLDQVPQLMRERAQQIQGEVDLTQPGMDPEAKTAEVKRRLAREFGLK